MNAISWIKIETSSFDNNKIRLINKMPQGDMILCTWFRLLIEAGKSNDNGYVYIDKDIPYTCEMLGRLFDRSVKKMKMALDTLKKFKLIDVDDNDFIRIINWDKHQNVEKMNLIKEAEEEKLNRIRMQGRERAARYRERKRINEKNGLKDELERYSKENNNGLNKRMVHAEEECSKEAPIYNEKISRDNDVNLEDNGSDSKSGKAGFEDNEVVLENSEMNLENNGAALENDEIDLKNNQSVEECDEVILENYDSNINEAEIGNDQSKGIENESKVMKNESNVIVTESNVTVTDKNKIRNRIRDREETDTNRDKDNCVSVSNVKENEEVTESNALSFKSDSNVINNKSYENGINAGCDNRSIVNKQDDGSLGSVSIDNNKVISNNGAEDLLNKVSSDNNMYADMGKLDNPYEEKNYYKLTEKEEEAVSIIRNYEHVSGKCGWIDFSVVKLMLKEYEKKYVEMAFDRAVNAKKFKMNYICGILRNWKNYGYPKEGEDFINGRGNKLSFGADKEKFRGIKKECRSELTNNEWEELERELI